MKTLNDYIKEYSDIAKRLGYQGESINLLTQFLANASYISEVENIAYARESSIDKALLMNSKIQHCMNDMYSVYRGHCPRVVMSVKFLRPVSFMPYDEIIKSGKFSVYYIGHYTKSEKPDPETGEYVWTYETGHFMNTKLNTVHYIVGFLSPAKWSVKNVTNFYDNYYIESPAEATNLSNDVYVSIDQGGTIDHPVASRVFADHINDPKKNVFDLTTTDYGSRIYFIDYILNEIELSSTWESSTGNPNDGPSNINASVMFYEYSSIDSYNLSELQKLQLKGADLVPYVTEEDKTFLYGKLGYPERGLVFIPETSRDMLTTIHYKANRSRHLSTIFRSNSDIGHILEELYPEKVRSGKTYFEFESYGDVNRLMIYYIPVGESLTASEKEEFKEKRAAYYIVDKDYISIIEGIKWKAKFNISLELYKNTGDNYYNTIKEKLENYENKFNIVFSDELINEIKSELAKIPNVKNILEFNLSFEDAVGNIINSISEAEFPKTVYYEIESTVSTIVKS
jgi:hypothetical protein